MAKAPAFQMYVRDWLTDTELGQCEPATRGIWMDMLANMWVAPLQGQLDGTIATLARLCRCATAEMDSALTEIEVTGTGQVTRNQNVTDHNPNITVVCRRMLRHAMTRKANRDKQQRHRDKLRREREAENNPDVPAPSAVSAVSAVSSQQQTAPPNPGGDDVLDETKAPSAAKKPTKREQQAEAIETECLAVAKRHGDHRRKQTRGHIVKLLKTGLTPADLRAAWANYAQVHTDPAFRMKLRNFFGQSEEYDGYMPPWTPPATAPSDLGEARALAAQGACQ